MSHGGGEGGGISEPNLTPLLDVVLQLLMFFMMCVNFVSEQVNEDIRLPQSQAVKPMDKADNDVLFINLKPFALKDFQDRLPADVLARVQERFRDGDECILIPGKEPMRRSDLKVWLNQQYKDAKELAESHGGKGVNTAIVIRAHKEADYAQVFEILQLCKNVGYTRLKLRALTKNTPGGGT
ncbi:MAG TPA: biopolymer transporter ExbD [Gemmataceae bacterium]|nr:biopolymer transporter ExbD [Gemmataceae bacterium]